MARYSPPGRLWPIDGHRLHAVHHPRPQPAGPAGMTSPTVVFDAALGGSGMGWVFVEREVAGFASTFAYDRAGLGFSDAGPLPRDLPQMVGELRALLDAAQVPPPYVLVGHSFGALVVRQFAALHPELVCGLVLVDPPGLEEWAQPDAAHQAKLASGIRLARRGGMAARCGVAQFGAWLIQLGALRLAAACATLVSGGQLRKPGDFNLAPAALLPQELKPVMRWIWTRPRFYDALVAQMEALPAAAQAVAMAPPLGELPLAVLSAADAPPAQVLEHEGLARQSNRGTHRVARASGHWIPLEDPALVITAIRGVFGSA